MDSNCSFDSMDSVVFNTAAVTVEDLKSSFDNILKKKEGQIKQVIADTKKVLEVGKIYKDKYRNIEEKYENAKTQIAGVNESMNHLLEQIEKFDLATDEIIKQVKDEMRPFLEEHFYFAQE